MHIFKEGVVFALRYFSKYTFTTLYGDIELELDGSQ